jgi:heptosyltransferase-2
VSGPDRAGLPRTAVVHHRSGIGDLIWHIPYIRAIAARSASGQVTVIARPSCRASDLLAGEPCVERVLEFEVGARNRGGRKGRHVGVRGQLEFVRALRAGRFERIYIFSSRVRYGILAWLARIPVRAGFGFSAVERLFLNCPPYIPPHRGEGNWVFPEATAFAVAHGFVQGPVVPRMAVPDALVHEMQRRLEALPRPRYAFAIGASSPARNWGAERFGALASALTAEGCGVLLVGGPAEQALAQAIAAQVPAARRHAVAPLTQPSVLATAAAMRVCDFCLGNDTGALNLGVANGLPGLGLFGVSPPLRHDPGLHAITGHGMTDISVAAVLERLGSLGAPGLRRHAAGAGT